MNSKISVAEPEMVSSGRALLIDWANQQDHWVRAVVTEIIESQERLTDEQLEHFYQLLLVEKGLHEGDKVNVPLLTEAIAGSDSEQILSLESITDVENVNALSAGQTLDFNPRVTLVYGENATGKSGYARIVKGVAAVRTAESVLSDVTKPPAEPKATIGYRLGQSDSSANGKISVVWKGEKGIAPLTRIDVFDSKGVALHVDQELSYVYTPSDLSLFPLVVEAIEGIRKRLEKAKLDASGNNQFTINFSRQGSIYSKLDTLGASTDINELKALTEISKEEEDSLPELEEKVSLLRADNTDAALQLAQNDGEWLSSVNSLLNAFERFNVASYNQALKDLQLAEQSLETATKQSLVGESIPGLFDTTWQNFIKSGDDYIHECLSEEYPKPEDVCVYCRQELSTTAQALIKKYRDFCNNELSKAVSKAELQLKNIVAIISSTDPKQSVDTCRKRVDVNQQDQWLSDVIALCENANSLLIAANANQPAKEDVLASIKSIVTATSKRIQTNNLRIAELTTTGEARQKAFQTELATLQHLKERIALRGIFPAVSAYVEKAKWADRANTVLSKFKSLNTTLTNLSKTASQQLLNQDFESLFLAECQKLNAPTVTVDFSGKKGQAARKKYLAAGHKLSETLSEGEQKVIALADFIAESLLRKKSSPIIFDDPVNSLDYRRLKNVVDRIVALSQKRQVVVFTHNIWFATELLSRFEKNKGACSFYNIESDGAVKGIISGGTSPRTDSFNSLASRVNVLIENAKKAGDKDMKDFYIEKAYDVMRAVCEIVVENELLAGVTKRHRANVMFTALPKIRIDRLQTAIDAITPIFEKCCETIAAHSQPLETLSIRPTLEDLEKDWKSLQDARTAYMKN